MITGHNGFIGSSLIDYLKPANPQIIGVANKIGNSTIKQIKKNIVQITTDDIQQDVHQIIHLAAITDVDYCQTNPLNCFKTNVNGTQRMLELARKKDSQFIFMSSSHVYGIPKQIPIKENNVTQPISIYGASKLNAEIMCEIYSKTYGLDVAVMRLFSVYGNKPNGNDVISKMITQIKTNNTIKLGNLYPKRDFIHISDVVHAINIVMKNIRGFSTYNVGTGKSFSIKEIFNILSRISGKKIQIRSINKYGRKFEVKNMVADYSRIKKLGWKPAISIDSGLTKLLKENGVIQ